MEKKTQEPVLIIMAAGMGSRYGGLKQIDPVSNEGEIILDFSMYDAMMAGFKKVIFVIKHEIEEDFKKLIEGKSSKFLDVEYAFQELTDLPEGYAVPEGRTKPWGTGHAVLSCRHLVKGPFAVINADDYYGTSGFQTMYDFLENLAQKQEALEEGKEPYCMIGYEVEKTLTEHGSVARGVCRTTGDGYLADIKERLKIMWKDDKIAFTEDDGKTFEYVPAGTPVSMNFWGFSSGFMTELEKEFPAFLDKAMVENPQKGEYLLPNIVEQAMKDGRATVKVLKSQDRWYGVTYKEDKESVVNALQALKDKGIYPQKLWK